MRPAFLPEVFFDLSKIIEVVPAVHFVGRCGAINLPALALL
jgi:hypothetical protein